MKKQILIFVAVALLASSAVAALRLIRARETACGTSATQIVAGDGYSQIMVQNVSATPVYLGGSDVNTTTQGFPICSDTDTCGTMIWSAPMNYGALYCRVGTVTTTVEHLTAY